VARQKCSGRGIMLDMRRVFYAVAAACVFTFGPLAILRLESTTKLVQSLKDMAAALGVPGAAVGFILAGGRVHDIDWVSATQPSSRSILPQCGYC